MDEKSELFGDFTEPTEEVKTETTATDAVGDDWPDEYDEEAEKEAETKDETKDETEDEPEDKPESKDEVKPKEAKAEKVDRFPDFPKKDEGVGGAGFCNIFVRKMMNGEIPEDICAKVKSGEKTLQGCWNWIYSKMFDEYVRSNGRKCGGFGEDIASLIVEYFEDIPEGTVIKSKSASPSPSTCSSKSAPKKKLTKELVKKVAKKAASDAKRESAQDDFFSMFGM